MNRREFIGSAAMAAVGAAAPTALAAAPKTKMRAALLHLSMNMWGSYLAPGEKADPNIKYAQQRVRCDRRVWKELTALMQRRHYNYLVIDIGDTLNFPSHPELAVEGGWSPDELKAEVARLRGIGIEPIPKLNFSACHDAWLKQYGRMLSTPKYYQVVKDLINDVCDVFGTTQYFHLGMDEESALMQRNHNHTAFRQGDLLWHDVGYFFNLVEKRGARPITFAGSWARNNHDEFFKRMPKSVLQNFGIYGSGYDLQRLQDTSLPTEQRNPYGMPQWFNDKQAADLKTFYRLAESDFDFLSCSSNWLWPQTATIKNPNAPVTGRNRPQDPKSCAWFHQLITRHIKPEHLLGEMVVPWVTCLPEDQYFNECGINQLADALDDRS